MRHPITVTLLAALATATVPAAGAGPERLDFEGTCARGEGLRIAAVGDLLFHKRLQLQAYAKGGDFRRFWAPVADVLADADLTYGNLEGPAAHGVAVGGRNAKDPGRQLDGRVYSADLATLNFNFHPSVIADLKASGFDVVSTANNHAFDRGALGIERTIENLEREGLAFTGTRARGEVGRPWSVVTERNGWRIAWLACTYSNNGYPDRDDQILDCFGERRVLIAETMVRAAQADVDAVIVTPHWGTEGSHVPEKRQRELARELVEAGALAVIGTHPHVLQPWERIVTGNGREGLVIYSTGNFISNQRQLPERTGMIALLDLVRTEGQKARIQAVRYIPTWVEIDGQGHRVTELTGTKGLLGGVLKAALRIAPPGNRVTMDALRAEGHPCRQSDREETQ